MFTPQSEKQTALISTLAESIGLDTLDRIPALGAAVREGMSGLLDVRGASGVIGGLLVISAGQKRAAKAAEAQAAAAPKPKPRPRKA